MTIEHVLPARPVILRVELDAAEVAVISDMLQTVGLVAAPRAGRSVYTNVIARRAAGKLLEAIKKAKAISR